MKCLFTPEPFVKTQTAVENERDGWWPHNKNCAGNIFYISII